MQLSRAFFDPGVSLVATLGLVAILLLIATVPKPHQRRRIPLPDMLVVTIAVAAAGCIAFAMVGQAAGAVAATLLALVVCRAVRIALPRLSAAGVIEMSLAPLTLITATPWTYALMQEQGFPAWSLTALLVGAGFGVLGLAYGFATKLADEAAFTHARWRRPIAAPAEATGPRAGLAPKVSIHVPCYAEPPEVVIATLERLARLRYRNFEVIVCDNNTADEALWRPLERWCRAQTARRPDIPFKFFHVSPLKGAKAGALNFSLTVTARDAELIALVDADYLAEPDFLSRLTGFFADPNVGFVQTPHDYIPDASAYQRMCYWEYMPPNKVGLASIAEYDCAYTIGTMCLFRKDAIAGAGGWAEWCLTEDSEISIRIRDLGYEGVYVGETFGRGLIPETYEDYKKQRFRWTAGPVQQLLAHWRLFLPRILGGRSRLHPWAKLMEVHRALVPVVGLFSLLAGAVGVAAGFWLTLTDRVPQLHLPPVFWMAMGVATAATALRLWQRYRLTGLTSPAGILGAEVARISLEYVKLTAAIAALTGRELKWRRTPKFAARGSALRAVSSTVPELTGAALLASAGFAALACLPDLGRHLAWMVSGGCFTGTAALLCAPVMAVFSEARLAGGAGEAAVPSLVGAEPDEALSRVA